MTGLEVGIQPKGATGVAGMEAQRCACMHFGRNLLHGSFSPRVCAWAAAGPPKRIFHCPAGLGPWLDPDLWLHQLNDKREPVPCHYKSYFDQQVTLTISPKTGDLQKISTDLEHFSNY
ncbi:hypothetical protein JRQ81_011966 [Phrynocephalus forsythii]|uniref:Uncharacterized protein n=1 Tax=Phrynocephalus forsythii TaxID=171643 RepID=A0A9Q1AQL8_9SAUR|nr:hypothetical protein JRQ81_011966 [Phrynocephalus forsythii]